MLFETTVYEEQYDQKTGYYNTNLYCDQCGASIVSFRSLLSFPQWHKHILCGDCRQRKQEHDNFIADSRFDLECAKPSSHLLVVLDKLCPYICWLMVVPIGLALFCTVVLAILALMEYCL